MDKLTEAIKNLIPEGQDASEVAKAVEEMMADEIKKLDEQKTEEYNAKLEEAYKQVEAEKEEITKSLDEGYKQAYAIIDDLKQRLDSQREEFDSHLEEQYEEAYAKIQEEKNKNENIEKELYEEFDSKLKQMHEHMVDQVDRFLQTQEAEMYAEAKKEILNDPRMVEHKVALDKITQVLGGYLSDENYSAVTNSKLEEAYRAYEDLKGQIRVLETKNVRLQAANGKLNEAVNQAQEVINESKVIERKERTEKAQNASGRGTKVDSEELIKESVEPAKSDNQTEVVESSRYNEEQLALAGINN